MSEVIYQSADYLHVLSRQLDRVLELGTRVWDKGDGTAERFKLRAFVGAVWQLYHAARPLVRRRLPSDGGFFLKAMALKEERGSLLEVWEKTNEMLEAILEALHAEGLLVRRSVLRVE